MGQKGPKWSKYEQKIVPTLNQIWTKMNQDLTKVELKLRQKLIILIKNVEVIH